MDAFIQRHQEDVIGAVSGFDRMRFRGTLSSICHAEGVDRFLGRVGVRYEDFKGYLLGLSQTLIDHAERVAQQAGRPCEYVASSQEDKQAKAQKIAQRDGITEGLVCVLRCVESCRSFGVCDVSGYGGFAASLAGLGGPCDSTLRQQGSAAFSGPAHELPVRRRSGDQLPGASGRGTRAALAARELDQDVRQARFGSADRDDDQQGPKIYGPAYDDVERSSCPALGANASRRGGPGARVEISRAANERCLEGWPSWISRRPPVPCWMR